MRDKHASAVIDASTRPAGIQNKNWFVCPYVSNLIFFFNCQVISSDHFDHRPLQNLHIREAVRTICVLSFRHHACLTCMTGCIDFFDRYSNTLLVSLNNRISIRDTYGSRGGTVDCQGMAFPGTGSAHLDATADRDITYLECRKQDLMNHSSAGANGKDESVVSCK